MAYRPFALTYTPEPVSCSGGEKPGARLLQDWACDESPWAADLWDVGIYACRDVFGGWCPDCDRDNLSAHASGRAGDTAHNIVAGHSHPSGLAFAAWLVANHAVLGVQEVICNGRRWTNQTQQWRTYSGVSPHVDHVHWTLNQSGALYLTRDRLLSVAPSAQEDHLVYKIVWFKSADRDAAAYRCLFAEGKDGDVTVQAWWIPNPTSLKRWRARLAEQPSSDPITPNPFTVIWNGPYKNFTP